LKIKKYSRISSSVNLTKKRLYNFKPKKLRLNGWLYPMQESRLKIESVHRKKKTKKIKKKKMNLAKKRRKTKKTADFNCGKIFAQMRFF
jgi:hypothetical protein